jgi:hypothetical protein
LVDRLVFHPSRPGGSQLVLIDNDQHLIRAIDKEKVCPGRRMGKSPARLAQ